jgi:hypothetical protein
MNEALATQSKTKLESGSKGAVGRLFVLELSAGRIHSMNTDGSDKGTIVTGCRLLDGIVVDIEAGHIYWTNMGSSPSDGSIERADINGKNRTVVVPEGVMFTPKQIHLGKGSGKLYGCDHEGMRVMRSNLDGSQVETLIESGRGDADHDWTQGPDNGAKGRRFRAGVEIPNGETAANISDIEVFLGHLPGPIDVELVLENRALYWTDRGDPLRGNTVNRASIDAKPQAPEILLTHLMEGIGIALDVANGRMFVTDLAGSIYSAKLDGSRKRNFLHAQVNLTGIAYAEI